jgi:sulfonate transport system substrate-binding protein
MRSFSPARRDFLRHAALASLALPLTACAGGAAGNAGAASVKVADQNGSYKSQLTASRAIDDVSFRVEWLDFPAAQPLLEALRAGAADVGIAGDAPTLTAFAAKAPIKVIAVLQRVPSGTAILVPAASPITSVSQLRGKSLTPTTRGSIGHYLALKALEREGIQPDQVRFNFLQPTEARAAFETGNVDAWSTWDPYTATVQTKGARVLTTAEGISAGHTYLVANQSALDDPNKRAALVDLTQRYKRSWQWTTEHRDEYAGIYAQVSGLPIEASRLIQSRSPYTPVPIDDRVVRALQVVSADYHRAGFLPREADVTPLFERSFT